MSLEQGSFYSLKTSKENEKGRSVLCTLPSWLPPVVAHDVQLFVKEQSNRFSWSFSRGERKIFRRRKPIAVSLWAERHRILEMSSIPGKWKNLFTPYLAGIMDAMGTVGVETVIICKTPQCGGSEAGHNFVGWCIDRSAGPAMYVFPDEITARENAKDRIIPMLNASPRLKEYMTGMSDDTSSLRINLMHMPIYLAWSGSVSRLGNKPIRTLILDELDKYKNAKNEATSEVLAEKRTTTWRNRRHIVKISTPSKKGNSAIWTALTEEAEARFDYFVKCSHCGISQFMEFEQIGFLQKERFENPKPEEKEELLALAEKVIAQKSAYYVCKHCGAVWNDTDRDRAVRQGEWFERKSGLSLFSHISVHRPIKVGFQIPAYLSYFVSLSEVAYAYMKYKATGLIEDLKNFMNQYLAEPWEEVAVHRSEDDILMLCDERPRGAVPGNDVNGEQRIACLLATVDTQKYYFKYVIRAWGYGENPTTWLVQEGSVANTAALNELFWRNEYFDPHGNAYKVRTCMIDAMGDPERTLDVVNWASKNRGRVIVSQGVHSPASPVSLTPWEWVPTDKGQKKVFANALTLHRVDTTLFKGALSAALSVNPADPGAFLLHENSKPNELTKGILDGYAREMSAETWNEEKRIWENVHRRPNHAFDCEYYQFALAWILNIKNIPHPNKKKARPKPRPSMPQVNRLGAENILANLR